MKKIHESSIRNSAPILEVLRTALPPTGTVLEIASGSGYHAVQFAAALPGVRWQPSDRDAAMRDSIAAHVAEAGLANVAAPVALDVTDRPWPVTSADAVVCINMIHISPWPATEALFAGAGQILARNGVVFTYGPYSVDGDFRGEGNVMFDRNLRARNAAWGIRDLNQVEPLAAAHGLTLVATVAMPANNLSLVFRKTAD